MAFNTRNWKPLDGKEMVSLAQYLTRMQKYVERLEAGKGLKGRERSKTIAVFEARKVVNELLKGAIDDSMDND